MTNVFPPSFILNYLWKETTGNFTIFQTMGLNFFLNGFLCSVRNISINNACCVFVYFYLFSPKLPFPPSPFLGDCALQQAQSGQVWVRLSLEHRTQISRIENCIRAGALMSRAQCPKPAWKDVDLEGYREESETKEMQKQRLGSPQ